MGCRRGVRAQRRHGELVDYSLTDLGQTLVEPIGVLTKWATRHGEAVVEAQEAR
ncbi:hypothetical protein [Amycolatopsis sp. NBC_00355]|uniref:hypothetical protein n=1 Tax=Amycolatopsis sp. NBC_00355 TaxID=2975957 RepID=UPI003FA4CF81